MKFSYTVSLNTDHSIFKSVCSKIEDNITEIKKDKLLIDVDGTEIQIYRIDSSKIIVMNDYEVDAVYVDSDINIGNLIISIV